MEGAVKFFDMIYSDEYADILHWGVEGETYEIRDGEKVKIELGSNEDKAEARKTEGSPLWGGLLPRVQMGSFQASLDDVKKSDRQRQVMLEAIDYENWSPMMLSNFLAMPTEEETERINGITTGLTTYSEEMATKICLGQMPMDNFDDYLAELKELGLDELLAIQQARYDRFKASME